MGFLCVYLASDIATSSAYSIHFQSHDQIISHSGQVHLQNCLSSPASPHLLRLQSSVLPPGAGLEKSVAAAAWHAHTKGMMAPKSKGAQSQTKVQIPPGAFSTRNFTHQIRRWKQRMLGCCDARSFLEILERILVACASFWEQLKRLKALHP